MTVVEGEVRRVVTHRFPIISLIERNCCWTFALLSSIYALLFCATHHGDSAGWFITKTCKVYCAICNNTMRQLCRSFVFSYVINHLLSSGAASEPDLTNGLCRLHECATHKGLQLSFDLVDISCRWRSGMRTNSGVWSCFSHRCGRCPASVSLLWNSLWAQMEVVSLGDDWDFYLRHQ